MYTNTHTQNKFQLYTELSRHMKILALFKNSQKQHIVPISDISVTSVDVDKEVVCGVGVRGSLGTIGRISC